MRRVGHYSLYPILAVGCRATDSDERIVPEAGEMWAAMRVLEP